MDQQLFYDIVAEELDAGIIHKGVMVHALSESSGDDSKARSIYIKLRVRQIKAQAKESVRAEREATIKKEREDARILKLAKPEVKRMQAEEKKRSKQAEAVEKFKIKLAKNETKYRKKNESRLIPNNKQIESSKEIDIAFSAIGKFLIVISLCIIVPIVVMLGIGNFFFK